jgi:hypothetical protein
MPIASNLTKTLSRQDALRASRESLVHGTAKSLRARFDRHQQTDSRLLEVAGNTLDPI